MLHASNDSLGHLGEPEDENVPSSANIEPEMYVTLNKRNAALKEARLMLSKAEEERAEYWRKLQLEIREKKTLAAKLLETQANLDDVTERLKASESNRKALSRTLQTSTVKDSPVKPSPVVTPVSIEPQLKLEIASLTKALEEAQASLAVEREKRATLKAAVKGKVDRFEEARKSLEAEMIETRWTRDAALADCASLKDLAVSWEQQSLALRAQISSADLEISSLKETVTELENFKKQAMREWMLQNLKSNN